ncbi:MAG: RNA polymerase sigma factor [Bacteroidales bacterium]|nr:RNA polymerase sigma factor [Bacteroidales bacterium]
MAKEKLDNIIQGCLKGREKSREELFRLYSAKLYGVSLYYAGHREEAQDILHDAFIKIFENIKQFTSKGSFEGWMRRIVINTALEKHRRNAFVRPTENAAEESEGRQSEDPDSMQGAQELIGLIRELSPQYRMVFNLYAIEGYSHKEISDMMNISEGTSKSNLARARSILREKVNKVYHLPADKSQDNNE